MSRNLFLSEVFLLTSADSLTSMKKTPAFLFLIQAFITRLALPLLVSRFSNAASLTSSYLCISRRREEEEEEKHAYDLKMARSTFMWAQIESR